MNDFQQEVAERILANGDNSALRSAAAFFTEASIKSKYSYNFSCLGRPIIQYPQDIVAMQEIIWKTRPDLIIETGIAHGGSLILNASMLAMLDMCDAIKGGIPFDDPTYSQRKVIGVDIEIRPHNRLAIENHPMGSRIQMIEGSSIASETVNLTKDLASGYSQIMVCLDSNHTHDHVLAELESYAPLTSKGNYCVVFDTIIEDMPESLFSDRPWRPGNNPKTAVREYLKSHPEFQIDLSIQNKLLTTAAPDGYLKRVS